MFVVVRILRTFAAMKTYLSASIGKLRQLIELTDAKQVFCDKPWRIFSQSEENNLYIFQKDNTLLITKNGKVSRGTWQFITANKSIILTTDNESYMLNPKQMGEIY